MANDHPIDLDRYFARVDLSRAVAPDLVTLNAIVAAHVAAIPFENIDVLTGVPISVAPEAIERKLVGDRRGGYCFEQNTLLMCALRAIGFDVTPISARVLYQKPLNPLPSRTHLFLRVELDGTSWLVDVGVGGLSPTSALRLVLNEVQSTPHEDRRLIKRGDWSGFEQRSPDAVLYHQAFIGGEWANVCEFTLEEMHPIDVELANWYTSAHPGSHFKDRLTVALAFEGGRKTILNREFKVRTLNGDTKVTPLDTDESIRSTLASEFGIELPPSARLACPSLD